MGRPGVPYQDVAKAADELVAEGARPTTKAVRERLGNTGSNTTIGEHLEAWRTARAAAGLAPTHAALPPAIALAVAEHIEGEISAVKKAAAAALADETSARSQADRDLDRIREELEAATTRINELDALVAEDRGRIAQLQDFTAALEKRISEAQTAVADADKRAAVAAAKLEAAQARATAAEAREREVRDEVRNAGTKG